MKELNRQTTERSLAFQRCGFSEETRVSKRAGLITLGGFILAVFLMMGQWGLQAADSSRSGLALRSIDTTRVGEAVPDSSAAMDIDLDGEIEVLSSMQDRDGHPEVLLYNRNFKGEWERTRIGVMKQHKGEIEWVAIGKPFQKDPRFCVAASVQHKEDGLVVLRLREPGLNPFDPSSWEKGVAKGYAGQGLAFQDLTGDGVDELIYCTQAGNELGVLRVMDAGNPMVKSGWVDHVIDTGNDRAWWWLNGKFYDLNGDRVKNDFFASTRGYGGSDLGMWKVTQTRPNDVTSYRIEKVYKGNSLQFDTGFLFSSNRERQPDIVMVNKPSKKLYLMDGRNDYETTQFSLNGAGWNVKVLPFLDRSSKRDAFVVATANSPSLFWSFQWRDGAYNVWPETEHAGDYSHPMDGTFTIADVDSDGEEECVVPDSAGSDRSKGLAYLDRVDRPRGKGPSDHFHLDQE